MGQEHYQKGEEVDKTVESNEINNESRHENEIASSKNGLAIFQHVATVSRARGHSLRGQSNIISYKYDHNDRRLTTHGDHAADSHRDHDVMALRPLSWSPE